MLHSKIDTAGATPSAPQPATGDQKTAATGHTSQDSGGTTADDTHEGRAAHWSGELNRFRMTQVSANEVMDRGIGFLALPLVIALIAWAFLLYMAWTTPPADPAPNPPVDIWQTP